ncbi:MULTISPECIES: diaminopimelate decarboxylase [Chromohalobacter]|jgi:diaminopimelate decarboxylase|uniref:diaminopimelate decarboxylase n=1 Tax=Chromohalobacter TaxID=42054 RepID=UPI0005582910|nr:MULTISPECIES: diaminopimelate decarboxylase [Chromohalobacter]MBZ5874957.1 diaminopimelate decarboxylase [Chromohalobacter salexigens]MDF9434578.1 diaminopimelate decarboxylase [Chromohalobacter israelensis]MDO0945699.1 diaminopimelate decarboxylase [Chromohalobacter salexigens]NQY46376.1 diaminopimelate decarboxylase [Chromohalobacter sp.]NWO57639.1 diaminopimelate decarboxylase [Chromohalobacter salexigens]
MDHFNYRDGHLHAENVPLADIAERFGTPCYVYSRATFTRHFKAYSDALGDHPHLICYAVKANSNLAVLDLLARLGAGFDIVSRGELERVLAAGGDPAKVVFSGVAKQAGEMARALEVGIKCFNVESLPELERLNQVAGECGQVARVSLRVNPDVDAKTHPYISTGLKANKFGIAVDEAFAVYQRAAELPNLEIVGLDCHIGSQLTELAPFLDALDRLLILLDRLNEAGITIEHLDLGGGLGVPYQDEQPPAPYDYARALLERLDGRDLTLLFEPGRSIAANAGVMLTRVEYLKPGETQHFAIVDAGMNDLIRPALYQAWQRIVPVDTRQARETAVYDVVGPVCETGDFLGKARELAIAPGDLLAVRSAGAYGFVMASHYNSRPRPAELMVDGDNVQVVRERETLDALWAGEHRLAETS